MQFDPRKAAENQGYSYSLTLTLAYNESDRTFGLQHTTRDFSIYLDKQDEQRNIISTKSRFQVTNQIGVPVVRIQQQHRTGSTFL